MKAARRASGPKLALLLALAAVMACGHAEPGDPAPEAAVKVEMKEAEAAPAPAPTSCGKTGLPDCPLQAWMKSTLQANLKAGDLTRVGAALGELARVEPHGFDGWAASALAGAAAARSGNVEGVRAQCRSCHDKLRPKFRSELHGARLL